VPDNQLYIRYHDEEWGVPVHEDRLLFEAIVLDGAQAGLSWFTILKRRDNYRQAYENFNPETVAAFDQKKIEELLGNKGVIRNRLKIKSSIQNAQAFIKIQEEFGSFDTYIWQFVGGKPIINRWQRDGDIPATSSQSDAMSKDLKSRGFSFVGSTICYAFMQAVGMVNDHTLNCFRYQELI
jgi:DNA-3-methyladenine glycosylase I